MSSPAAPSPQTLSINTSDGKSVQIHLVGADREQLEQISVHIEGITISPASAIDPVSTVQVQF